ncbi:MAG: di-trans,poly-cis-decaprenylcistransferase [Planctomycetes bacterium]|nr:di-trans,poly-cis-decaprenylcistransferase [Planctomycetota bacterium]
MIKSTFEETDPPTLHVAIIMDGNGRWATARGLPRHAGHQAGARSVRRVIEAAPGLGIRILTLFAFSSDNWKRPVLEVSTLMRLFRMYLASETERCIRNGVRVSVIGRRDRLPIPLQEAISRTEERTRAGETLHLRLAVDYSSRDAILAAAGRLEKAAARGGDSTREAFSRWLGEAEHGSAPAPDVDVLIRTGGEQRLSDFLLWESAYAELFFVKELWPDFTSGHLQAVLEEFRRRERRFGAVPQAAVSSR